MHTQSSPSKDMPLTFEAALAELEGIVRDLESGKAPLEQSIAAYERGMVLKKICEDRLNSAQLTIDQVMANTDGSLMLKPVDETTLT